MTFYRDLNLHDNEHQYFHNVLVTCIGLASYLWDEAYPDIDEIWDLRDLTSALPQAIWVYRDEEIDETDYDWELYKVPHAVVAIGSDQSVTFFDTEDIEFKEEWDPWEI